MSEQSNLFWYPAIHGLNWADDFDKGAMLDSYVRYFLARLQSMFKYDGLPDTIPAKYLESYLLCNGNALIAKAPTDGKLYAFTGGMGGNPNAYYIPRKYIVANPYLQFTETYDIQNEFEDGNAVLIYNDTYSQGLIPMLRRYCMQLVENDITLQLADVLARATINISATDDKTKKSAELWLKRLKEGKLGIIAETAFLEGLNIREFQHVAQSITPLIEYHQYIKASLYNELGLNSNYNMKRESINSNESQLNDDMLHPLIDDMLRERKEGIERVNKLFGLNISVDFDGAWLENEKEEQAVLGEIDTEAGADFEDDTKIYPGIDTEDASEVSTKAMEDASEMAAEETTEEETTEAEEAAIIEDNNAAIVEALENIADALEADKEAAIVTALKNVTDAIEGDTRNDE